MRLSSVTFGFGFGLGPDSADLRRQVGPVVEAEDAIEDLTDVGEVEEERNLGALGRGDVKPPGAGSGRTRSVGTPWWRQLFASVA